MEELIKKFNEILSEANDYENPYEKLYYYMNRNYKNKRITPFNAADLKFSEMILFLALSLKNEKDFDFEKLEKNINKIKSVTDTMEKLDLFLYINSLENVLKSNGGKFDMDLMRHMISENWDENIQTENIQVDARRDYDVIQKVSTTFKSVEDALTFIKIIEEVNHSFNVQYKDPETKKIFADLDLDFLHTLQMYVIISSNNKEESLYKDFISTKIQENIKSLSSQYNNDDDDIISVNDEFKIEINKYVLVIGILYNDIQAKYKEEERVTNLIIKDITKLKSIVQERMKSEQFPIKESDFQYLIDQTRELYIPEVFKSNHENYLKLINDYEENIKLNNNEFDKILAQHNLIIQDKDTKEKILELNSIEEIEKMCSILNNNHFNFVCVDESLLIKVLKYSSYETLKNIKKLIDSEIITDEFVEDNKEVLISKKNDELKVLSATLITNIHTLSGIAKIKNIKKKCIDLFLLNPTELQQRVNILKLYNIDLKNTDITNFLILTNPKQIDIVDSYIELGLYNIVINNPEITRYDSNKTKRINIYKELNEYESINDISKVKKIMKDGFYGIEDNQLDLYTNNIKVINESSLILEESNNIVIDNKISDLKLLRLFNKYSFDNMTYHIDDIVISKNKVLRCMTTLYPYIMKNEVDETQALLTAITYNSILNEEQLEKVKEVVMGLDAPSLSKVLP